MAGVRLLLQLAQAGHLAAVDEGGVAVVARSRSAVPPQVRCSRIKRGSARASAGSSEVDRPARRLGGRARSGGWWASRSNGITGRVFDRDLACRSARTATPPGRTYREHSRRVRAKQEAGGASLRGGHRWPSVRSSSGRAARRRVRPRDAVQDGGEAPLGRASAELARGLGVFPGEPTRTPSPVVGRGDRSAQPRLMSRVTMRRVLLFSGRGRWVSSLCRSARRPWPAPAQRGASDTGIGLPAGASGRAGAGRTPARNGPPRLQVGDHPDIALPIHTTRWLSCTTIRATRR